MNFLNKMKYYGISVPVLESERGWGSKIDDHMVCLTIEDSKLFIEDFNKKNNEDIVPDWYMKALDETKQIELTEEQFNLLSEQKRIWKSKLF